MQALSRVPTLQPAIALLEKTPAMLELLLRDVPGDILDWKSAEERWSIKQVLAHLLVIEQLYGDRAKRIVVDENPALVKFTPPDEAKVRMRTARQHLDDFVASRRAHIFFWHSIPANGGSRTGMHHGIGQVTLHQMLNELANHDLGHLRQIAEIYRAKAFYPHAGPFQRYSSPKP
jgi:hypothetical protein